MWKPLIIKGKNVPRRGKNLGTRREQKREQPSLFPNLFPYFTEERVQEKPCRIRVSGFVPIVPTFPRVYRTITRSFI